jgi:hypothetical protein
MPGAGTGRIDFKTIGRPGLLGKPDEHIFSQWAAHNIPQADKTEPLDRRQIYLQISVVKPYNGTTMWIIGVKGIRCKGIGGLGSERHNSPLLEFPGKCAARIFLQG